MQQRDQRFGVALLNVDVAITEDDDVVETLGVDIDQCRLFSHIALTKGNKLILESGLGFSDLGLGFALSCDDQHMRTFFHIIIKLHTQ